MLVVLPRQIVQVQRVLRLCHERKVPVVARGAGTGLSGGALPLEKGVLLVMARFNNILHIDPAARTARVQPGMRNLAISQAAAPFGLYYAPAPSSQIACSIGGNVAENAGGVHCLKYGLTVHNLLKVDILTVDGEHLSLGSDALDSPGFAIRAAEDFIHAGYPVDAEAILLCELDGVEADVHDDWGHGGPGRDRYATLSSAHGSSPGTANICASVAR